MACQSRAVRHLKSTLIQMCVHVDEAMGLSVHTKTEEATTPYYVRATTTLHVPANVLCNCDLCACFAFGRKRCVLDVSVFV